ncbi:hypothetical protein GMD78_00645 [Ornithinibacillus sp. L9]|uniref:ABC-2 type transporter transmembrane domain-containing protein n=1 Tax=Ornithinibacillus caprae TaxID=2678566 RepID=A0A6N8FBJ0_9BACI|nr:ABC transporter permease [Ornithinibacillus caprae]MUK86910.1 hypothetical protein [Ornithinibacillus caprae]
MKDILVTRVIRWKKQVLSVLFWLLFPLIATSLFISFTEKIQQDTQVPIGIVLGEETPLALGVLDAIEQSPLVEVTQLTEDEALIQLEKHALDSVFIIHQGYEEQIRKGNRTNLITSYRSDRSLAYSPVKEMVVSFVQQETIRSKAAYVVMDLETKYKREIQRDWEEIIQKSKEVQAEQDLLHTTFQFQGATQPKNENPLFTWNVWGIWAVFTLLSTLLLLDWVIKENSSNIRSRFTFTKIRYHHYVVKNLLFYLGLFIIVDGFTLLFFYHYFSTQINMFVLFTFRVMITLLAFIIALLSKNVYLFYCGAFAFTLFITVISGVFLPVNGFIQEITWLQYVNPLHQFLSEEVTFIWLVGSIILLCLWYFRKEKVDA